MEKTIEVFYIFRGKNSNALISIEGDFLEDGYYIWQKAIRSLHGMHDIVNITKIEIGEWSSINS